MADVPPSGIRKFFDVVSEMDGVISLGVGEPDFNTPWTYTDAAIYSLRRGHTHYTSNWGLIELRRAINRYLTGRFETEYDPTDEILVTVGASEGIDLALRALVEPGDEVIVPDPSYVSYMPNIRFAGGVCVAVPTVAEEGFRLTPERLRAAITPKTKALILPYPNNPTGAVMGREDLTKIAEVLRGTDIMVISDEIYAELTYEGKHVSFAAIPGMWERTITLNGFSKAFAMTGWRMGFACGPREVMAVMCKIHQYTMLCAPTPGQYAALEALSSANRTTMPTCAAWWTATTAAAASSSTACARRGLPATNRAGLSTPSPPCPGAWIRRPSAKSCCGRKRSPPCRATPLARWATASSAAPTPPRWKTSRRPSSASPPSCAASDGRARPLKEGGGRVILSLSPGAKALAHRLIHLRGTHSQTSRRKADAAQAVKTPQAGGTRRIFVAIHMKRAPKPRLATQEGLPAVRGQAGRYLRRPGGWQSGRALKSLQAKGASLQP